jgi:hypothetical protein
MMQHYSRKITCNKKMTVKYSGDGMAKRIFGVDTVANGKNNLKFLAIIVI